MVDLTPIYEVVVSTLAVLLMALGSYAITKLSQKLRIDADSQFNAILNDALVNAVDYAVELAHRRGESVSKLDVRNQVVADAVNYVMEGVPDVLRHFGLTPERISKLVLARLRGDFHDFVPGNH